MKERKVHWLAWLAQRMLAGVGAVVLTAAIFLILPVMQTISAPPARDLTLVPVDVANVPPPPPAPPEPEPDEPPEPEEPPELEEQAQPLDLSQLELALNPGMGSGAFGDFDVDLGGALAESQGDSLDQIFTLADLDQRPRILFQRPPRYPPELRKARRQGTVEVLFTVTPEGRVSDPRVVRSTDPGFDAAALEAVRQWRFEPGKRKGEKVSFRMKIPITFNAG